MKQQHNQSNSKKQKDLKGFKNPKSLENLKKLNRDNFPYPLHPEKIIQFGEGNFLRCFVDWQVDILNEKKGLDAGVAVVRPIDTETPPSLDTQDGLYTAIIRGYDETGTLQNQKRIISSVNREISVYKEFPLFLELAHNPDFRFIFSNTTEAGIAFDSSDAYTDAPPSSFPGKLTRLLHERFLCMDGSADAGFILLPCELIDYNGEALKGMVNKYADLWELGEEFKGWIEEANTFCSTLVDRIVTGHPREEALPIQQDLGYRDDFITTGEFFHLFVIEGPEFVGEELKIAGSGLNIRIVDDLKPYKTRKVGILNASHTALVPVAFLSGIDLVKEALEEQDLKQFLSRLIDDEIIPNLGLPIDYAQEFASSVLDRFRNPFINHQLLSISLNSMTKFKTRLLPQFLEYFDKTGHVPPLMSFSLAGLICFYKGMRKGTAYETKDNPEFLELFDTLWSKEVKTFEDALDIAHAVLCLSDHWGKDLSSIPELETITAEHVLAIETEGMRERLHDVLKNT
ncbi:MAG: tagaturonate reductase [Spirochaetia bacterium]|nr:tagaturonate reductase [Spirochaetia bacterium]